jgi:hypothetical protein
MWNRYSTQNNTHYTFNGQVKSGPMRYPSEGCSAYFGYYNREGEETKISSHSNISDEDLRGGRNNVDHIHTHILHPYCYQLASWLFANFHQMHKGASEWYKFDFLLSINLEAFVQGFQQNCFNGENDDKTRTYWRYNQLFEAYGWPYKRDLKTDLEVCVGSYFIRLNRWTNSLTSIERTTVVQSYLQGFYIGKCFRAANIDIKAMFSEVRDSISKVYMMPDNGYQIEPERLDCRLYKIDLCFPANLIYSDFEKLDKVLVAQHLQIAHDKSSPLYYTILNCIFEGNMIRELGQSYCVD